MGRAARAEGPFLLCLALLAVPGGAWARLLRTLGGLGDEAGAGVMLLLGAAALLAIYEQRARKKEQQ